jgi:hypothetical protein
MEAHETASRASELHDELAAIEERLIRLTREAGSAERPLEAIINDLAGLAPEVRRGLARVQEALERRDLTYDEAALQEMRRRALWLYRRSRLERVFYGKLRLERALRDSLYRQVLEAYDELSAMEAEESRLHGVSDDQLITELFREAPGQSERGLAD